MLIRYKTQSVKGRTCRLCQYKMLMSFNVRQLIAKLDLFEHCLKNVLEFNAKKMEGQVKVCASTKC